VRQTGGADGVSRVQQWQPCGADDGEPATWQLLGGADDGDAD
jgi:hypothetical protein